MPPTESLTPVSALVDQIGEKHSLVLAALMTIDASILWLGLLHHCTNDWVEKTPFSEGFPTVPWHCPRCKAVVTTHTELNFSILADMSSSSFHEQGINSIRAAITAINQEQRSQAISAENLPPLIPCNAPWFIQDVQGVFVTDHVKHLSPQSIVFHDEAIAMTTFCLGGGQDSTIETLSQWMLMRDQLITKGYSAFYFAIVHSLVERQAANKTVQQSCTT